MLPTDLDLPRILAIALIFAMWGLYSPILSALGARHPERAIACGAHALDAHAAANAPRPPHVRCPDDGAYFQFHGFLWLCHSAGAGGSLGNAWPTSAGFMRQ